MMYQKPFQGLASFMKTLVGEQSASIGIIGIPYDGSTSYRSGARFGPNAIRKASMMLTDGAHPIFGVDPTLKMTDFGDIPVSNIDVAKSLEQITEIVQSHSFYSDPSKRMLYMGGDHTITTGVLRAIAPLHPELQILHIDAHCDTWKDHFGDPLGHGTWVRNVIEEGLVQPFRVVQVGIRSPVDPETREWLSVRGGMVYSARDALRHPAQAVLRHIDRQKPLYVSFDIDALDPSYAPGTGTPEIGGLTPHYALELIEALAAYNVVGMDLVEVSPDHDRSEITALAGATLLWTMACAIQAGGMI